MHYVVSTLSNFAILILLNGYCSTLFSIDKHTLVIFIECDLVARPNHANSKDYVFCFLCGSHIR